MLPRAEADRARSLFGLGRRPGSLARLELCECPRGLLRLLQRDEDCQHHRKAEGLVPLRGVQLLQPSGSGNPGARARLLPAVRLPRATYPRACPQRSAGQLLRLDWAHGRRQPPVAVRAETDLVGARNALLLCRGTLPRAPAFLPASILLQSQGDRTRAGRSLTIPISSI